jgi:hypothetical protein
MTFFLTIFEGLKACAVLCEQAWRTRRAAGKSGLDFL